MTKARVAKYTLENPVRAGLAKSAADYPFVAVEGFTIQQVLEADAWQP